MAGPSSPFIIASPSATKSGAVVNLGPLSGLHEWQFWQTDADDRSKTTLTAVQAFKRVPWLYRAVKLRADTLADIPWALFKGKEEIATSDKDDERELPRELAWIKPMGGKGSDPTQDGLVDLIRKTELDLCLAGAAYWKRDSNKLIAKGFRRWLPTTITPKFDEDAGLVGFKRQVPGAKEAVTFAVEDIVFWWLPSSDAELGPGDAPAVVALRAAGLLDNIDRFGEGFFDRGAINTTILSIEGNPPEAEKRRLEQWWKRLLSGVKRAFETIAVSAAVKPIVVGQAPKDLALDTLTETKRRDIAAALGVPADILDSESANYATAKVSMLNYWRLTAFPEAEVIEGPLNRQIFSQLGYEFRFLTNQIESIQAEEDQKAYETLALVVGGVITPNELREQLDMEPIEGGDVLRTPPPPMLAGANDQSPGRTNAGMANQMIGSDAPRTNRQAERQMVNGLGTTRQSQGRGAGKAVMDIVELVDAFQALAPQPALPAKTVKTVERDSEGRIVAITEQPEVTALPDPFPGEGWETYP